MAGVRRDWKRWEGEENYRERRDAYAAFIANAERLHAGNTTGEDWQEYRKCEGIIRLIAPKQVEIAADKLGYLARGQHTSNAEYGGAKTEFYVAARQDLGKSPPPDYSEEGPSIC